MLKGLAVLFSCQLAGEILAHLFRLPVPGAVLGLGLLFTALCWRGRVPVSLQTASQTLLENLALLFVPAGVGMVSYLGLLQAQWFPIFTAVIISTLLTLAVTAGVLSYFLRGRGAEEREAGAAREFETELEQ